MQEALDNAVNELTDDQVRVFTRFLKLPQQRGVGLFHGIKVKNGGVNGMNFLEVTMTYLTMMEIGK